MTRCYRWLYRIFNFLSLAAFIAPPSIFLLVAYESSTLVTEKVTLTCTLFVALIISCISVVRKVAMKSSMWILLLGLYFVLDQFLIVLLLVGGGQVLDELIFSPVAAHYKQLYIINREIDKRG